MSVIISEIAKWDSFYVIVGSAAGALIGLQFVVLTLIAERPPVGGAEAGAAFGSPTIVHFGATLFVSALLHVPWQTIIIAATLWGLLGFSGVAYTVIVTRRMRKQAAYKPVFEDWLSHGALPLFAYAILPSSRATLRSPRPLRTVRDGFPITRLRPFERLFQGDATLRRKDSDGEPCHGILDEAERGLQHSLTHPAQEGRNDASATR
jgi:hypothetical protein